MRTSMWLTSLTLLLGCSSTDTKAPVTQTSEQRFVVHEWGTFTSVQASTGDVLEGLHHEDEALPEFVYGRGTLAGTCADCPKDLETVPVGVTQKLETPVIYFHGDHVARVSVTVDFPDGVVSQWFPNASAFAPELGNGAIAGGSMTWDAQLVPGLAGFPEVAPDDVWAPSRRVSSIPVKVGDEHEQFIFYRGLGAFETPFRVVSEADGTFTLENRSDEDVPAAFLLRLHDAGGIVVPLGGIRAHGEKGDVEIPVGGKEHVDVYVEQASMALQQALEADGLYPDEAKAMVDTWAHSYFRTPGLRILYVAPRAWSDALLPIHVSPTPDELVRTMVGRVEVLTRSEESEVVSLIEGYAQHGGDPAAVLAGLGRFAEPKLRRALQLLDDPAAKAACQSLIDSASAEP